MQHVLGEIEVVFCERAAHIVVSASLVHSTLHKLFVLRHDNVVAALSVGRGTRVIVDLLASVEGQYAVGHLAVYVVNLLVIKQHAVGGDGEAEILAVLLLNASCVVNGSLYGLPCH